MFPVRLGKFFVGHLQSVRVDWCPCCSSFVFAASVAVVAVSAGGTVVVVAASVAVSEAVAVVVYSLWLALLTRLSVATILLITIKTYNQLKVRIAEE
jgi:hypothetical protein